MSKGKVRILNKELRIISPTNRGPVHMGENCLKCIYLGHLWAEGMDLYFCEGLDRSLIARYGSDGEYFSGTCFWRRNKYLKEAARVALRMGLVTREELRKECGHTRTMQELKRRKEWLAFCELNKPQLGRPSRAVENNE